MRNKLGIRLVDGGKSFTEINNNCTTNGLKYRRVAFVVPYRDRLSNLQVFLNNMHPFLTRHNLTYGIYLIEPQAGLTFNRGLLMNIGFLEAIKDGRRLVNNESDESNSSSSSSSSSYWDCFVFHDVDLIPEDLRLHYTCNPKYPVHYSVAVSKFGYRWVSRGILITKSILNFHINPFTEGPDILCWILAVLLRSHEINSRL